MPLKVTAVDHQPIGKGFITHQTVPLTLQVGLFHTEKLVFFLNLIPRSLDFHGSKYATLKFHGRTKNCLTCHIASNTTSLSPTHGEPGIFLNCSETCLTTVLLSTSTLLWYIQSLRNPMTIMCNECYLSTSSWRTLYQTGKPSSHRESGKPSGTIWEWISAKQSVSIKNWDWEGYGPEQRSRVNWVNPRPCN